MRARDLIVVLVLAVAACSRAPEPPTAEIAAERTEAVNAAVAAQRAQFAAAPAPTTDDTAYQFVFDGLVAERVPMTAFQGDVVLVVNTASRCGFTPQYAGLQDIYAEYHERGFEVLGVPANNFAGQEPGSAQEIQEFCALNFGVTFPMAAKTDVVGDNAHPFYRWARAEFGEAAVPQWNFHKLLINREGRIVAAFPSNVTPTSAEIRAAIEAALAT
jgi:glutathione peroxidase